MAFCVGIAQWDYNPRMALAGNVFEQSNQTQDFRLVVDTIPTLAWSARPDGSADFFNRRWLEYTGLSAEAALNWGWKVAIHPDDLPRILEIFQEAVQSKQAFEAEGRLRRSDGNFRWFLFRGSPLLDGSGHVTRWYGTNTDIEDRKRAEDALRISEQSFRQTIDGIPGLVNIMAATGEIEFGNQQLLDYFGKTLEELQGWAAGDVVHPDDLPSVIAAWRHSVETGQPFDREHRLRRADGVYHWFHGRVLPVRDANGRIVRWYSLLTDIHERKQAEEEVKRLKDRLHDENVALREQIDQAFMFDEIVGASPALQSVLSSIVKVAPTDSTVLISGETGTGKELIARAIHKHSRRSGQAFLSVNCASIPSTLIASELFGHEKGAFTGALQQRRGRFELAHSGTIFLDEIGELPAETQIALLRVLQERQFERVGGDRLIPVDVRVIAATNRDLSAAIAAGSFRADLFYRLNVFPIQVPPLRKRREDIPMLVAYFVQRFAEKMGKQIRKIDKNTVDLCQAYHWPGNIRELQNIIERSVILCNGETFRIDEAWLSAQAPSPSESSSLLTETLQTQERRIIEAALAAAKGKVAGSDGAAARLGIPPSTLESKIKQFKIKKQKFAAAV